MIGIIITTVIALILSIILVNVDAYLDNSFKKEEEYLKLLPGYNCGACGFNSCEGMSEAMLEDVNNYKKCKPLRGDLLKNMEAYLKKQKMIE